jgi:hypothetical protein
LWESGGEGGFGGSRDESGGVGMGMEGVMGAV